MNIQLNKEKAIGTVLYIVEGGKTEPYLLHKIFCGIMNYQMETILRDKGYRRYNSQENPNSRVFVVNTEEKYSLQGTTQGNGLTGGVPPVRFSM